MTQEIKRTREYVEYSIVPLDRRCKKIVGYLELKELRLVNQLFEEHWMNCIEIRIKSHYGTREEFENINFG